MTLTESNFDSVVNSEEIILVEFYAPWCGHCKSLAPAYEGAAAKLLLNDPPIPLAKVDATVESQLASRFGVSGYPTLKVFRKGQHSDYSGPRDESGIVSYMKKQAGPSSRHISSEEELDKLLGEVTDVVFLGVFSEEKSAKKNVFLKTADILRESYKFADTSLSALSKAYNVVDGVVFLLPKVFHSKNEREPSKTTDLSSSIVLKKWVQENAFPVVGLFNEDTSERYISAPQTVVTLWANIDYDLDPKGSRYVANRLRRVASKHEPVVFAIADIRGSLARQLSEFGFSNEDVYAVTVKDKDGKKFRSDSLIKQKSSFSADPLAAFLEQLASGKVEPYIKSEEAPEQSTVKGLTTLTANTFEREIDDSGMPALIEFYAPWCGHCKKLAPIYEELAEKFVNHKVVIAKMDATANEVPPQYSVSGFPTIYYLPAGGEPQSYTGGRELVDFEAFLKNKKIPLVDSKEL